MYYIKIIKISDITGIDGFSFLDKVCCDIRILQLSWTTGAWGFYTQEYDPNGMSSCVYLLQPPLDTSGSSGTIMIKLTFIIFDFSPEDSVTIFEVRHSQL